MNINNLKAIILGKMKIPLTCQHWIINGQLWDNNTMVKDCRIQSSNKLLDVCLFLCGEHETIEFEDIVSVLDHPQLKHNNKIVAWSCPACTTFNEPTRPGCVSCSLTRPDNYRVPDDYCPTPANMKLKMNEQEVRQQFEIQDRETKQRGYQSMMQDDEVAFFNTLEKFDCEICMGDIAVGEGVTLRGCAHQLCLNCLRDYIGNIETAVVTCPFDECESQLEDREVRGVGGEAFYDRYVQLCNRLAAAGTENAVHCKTPNCQGWAIAEIDNGVYHCAICKKDNCLTCGAIHENMSCEKYQEDLRINAANDVAKKKDLEFLQALVQKGDAMHCPQCRIIIQKARGCDFVQCRNCAMGICWATKQARWGPGGKGDTSGGCKCNVNGNKCHPNCRNCH